MERDKEHCSLKHIRNLFFALFLLIFYTPLLAQETGSDPYGDSDSSYVQQLIYVARCKEAWSQLWPHVLAGSPRAALELLGELSWGDLYPPLPKFDPDGDEMPKDYQRFVTDLTFSVNPKRLRSKEFFQAAQSYKSKILSEFLPNDIFEKYSRTGCISDGVDPDCFNPAVWHANINDLNYWNTYFLSNKHRALCKSKGN